MKTIKSLLVLGAMLFAMFSYSQQSTFKDLWGMKAAYLGQELNKNGYYHIKTSKSGWNSYSYWWNYSKKKCISARVNNGKVASIVNSPAFDCNKSDDDSHYESQTYHSSSHHYDYDDQINNERSYKMAFDRGYKDGLYHVAYHNPYEKSSSKNGYYTRGYEKGVEDRKENTSYHSTKGGYAAHVEVADLYYKDAVYAYGQLEKRNFVEQKKHSDGDTTYRIFFNSSTGQCIKTTSKNKRIVKIENSTHCY